MRPILLWWRNLPPETKKQIMQSNGIKAIIYADIKRLYLEGRK
jgi:hypothetical protein